MPTEETLIQPREATDPFLARPSAAEIAADVRSLLAAGHLGPDTPAVLVHDLDRLIERLDALERAFPAGTLHAVAVKAQPLVEVLRVVVERGCGLEAASWEEVSLAVAAGCPPERIVYDSPAKTPRDLERALALGVHVNADNPDELARIGAALAENPRSRSTFGLRVNPCVGEGTIAAVSVGGSRSRFGVPIPDDPSPAVEAFRRHPWLTGLHVHVGSQGMSLDHLAEGTRRAVRIADAIDTALGPGRVATLDIGGGLPTTYRSHAPAPGLSPWIAKLREVPELWTGRHRLVTELGRALHASCGWAVSRVEYVRSIGGTPAAVLHVGADLLLRTAYRPEDWSHEALALDAAGHEKPGSTPTTLLGPLCFAGDVVARDAPLPALAPGDHVVLRDTGAYTLSMWSRHCSRGIPPVLGRRDGAWLVLREGEAPDDVVRFWSRRR
jgi:diaminopimelate decarboxylase